MTGAPAPFVPLDPRRVLTRIEELCAEPRRGAVDSLAELASPGALEDLFGLHLGRLVRQGPGRGDAADGPARLLALAAEAASRGVLPAAAPGRLRRRLSDLAQRLVEDGLWAPDVPPWWHPLPAAGALEQTAEAAARALRLPRPTVTRGAFDPDGRRWLALSDLLAPDWVATIHRQLEGAHGAGALDLEREGVGASGRRSVRRTDVVTYLTGRERAHLEAIPTLAVTVQELLSGLSRWLAESLPGARLAPPQTAMLARYEAPSRGFDPHLDNPGLGFPDEPERDNGRTLTLVTYLSAPDAPPRGGEIALWGARDGATPGASDDEPVGVFPPRGGSAVLFDSRRVPHQVRPVAEGPARWALTVWITDRAGVPEMRLPVPAVTPTEALVTVPDPPLPAGRVLFHELDGDDPAGRLVSRRLPEAPPPARAAVVATVYREGERLTAWCRHHLELGFERLFVCFDHLEEPAEETTAARLRERFGDRVAVLDGRQVARRWRDLPEVARRVGEHDLTALAGRGGAAWAVAARQALNASVVLGDARGQGLRWLLHLDGDERFRLEGPGRGGATLAEHFAAADAGDAAGLLQLRYLNHELLVPRAGTDPLAELRFKVNPRLAAARLGSRGWQGVARALGLGDDRPWFNGYLNGKSAVRVDAAVAAAGCHGWRLTDEVLDELRRHGATGGRLLAGPSVLHFHFAAPESFRAKYRAMGAVPECAEGERPFEPAPTEEAAVALVRRLVGEGVPDDEIDRALDDLHLRMTTFSDAEIELLDEVGLVLRP